jgi:hypothetical protein
MYTMRTFTIQRLTGEGRKKSYAATGDMISGFLETASPEFTAIVDGEFGKTFSLFSDEVFADVKIGDRLIDGEDSQSYDVRGVMPHKDAPGRNVQIALTLPIEQ